MTPTKLRHSGLAHSGLSHRGLSYRGLGEPEAPAQLVAVEDLWSIRQFGKPYGRTAWLKSEAVDLDVLVSLGGLFTGFAYV